MLELTIRLPRLSETDCRHTAELAVSTTGNGASGSATPVPSSACAASTSFANDAAVIARTACTTGFVVSTRFSGLLIPRTRLPQDVFSVYFLPRPNSNEHIDQEVYHHQIPGRDHTTRTIRNETQKTGREKGTTAVEHPNEQEQTLHKNSRTALQSA